MDLDKLIATEVHLYVNYCRLAARHDAQEELYKRQAHNLFYHIQELRSTRRLYLDAALTTDLSYSINAVKGDENGTIR